MSAIFLDTSSLLKLYHHEAGTEEVETVIAETDSIFLSELAKVEFNSAVWKNIRSESLTENDGNDLIRYFKQDYELFNWISIDNTIIHKASELLNRHGNIGLRSLDAIQLASALQTKNKITLYHTFDEVLQSAFEKEGF